MQMDVKLEMKVEVKLEEKLDEICVARKLTETSMAALVNAAAKSAEVLTEVAEAMALFLSTAETCGF